MPLSLRLLVWCFSTCVWGRLCFCSAEKESKCYRWVLLLLLSLLLMLWCRESAAACLATWPMGQIAWRGTACKRYKIKVERYAEKEETGRKRAKEKKKVGKEEKKKTSKIRKSPRESERRIGKQTKHEKLKIGCIDQWSILRPLAA